ncbi:MAG: sulfatase-like hydrolase/transferase, partial [Pseudomonadota bacterium]
HFGMSAAIDGRSIRSLILIALFFALLFLLYPFTRTLGMLGHDSMREVVKFSGPEALFYVRTLLVQTLGLWATIMILFYGLTALTVWYVVLLLLNTRKRRGSRNLVGLISHSVPLVLSAAVAVMSVSSLTAVYATNSEEFRALGSKVEIATERFLKTATLPDRSRSIRTVVFIGESTTNLHWSLYGYPRDTNAPLSPFRDDLIVFRDVVSNSSHTGPSILAAFTVPLDGGPPSTIPDPGASVFEILRRARVSSVWLSNQERSGSFAFSSRIMTGSAEEFDFIRPEAVTHLHWREPSAFDHDLVSLARPRLDEPLDGPEILVLHSYAGHGYYCLNIPIGSRYKVDSLLEKNSSEAILGAVDEKLVDSIDCYDSAMRYVSENIASVIRQIATSDVPTLFFYFADHGESPYTGTGHDSSRHRYEHVRVPMIFYVNDALNEIDPSIRDMLTKNADGEWMLSDLGPSLLDLYGIRNDTARHHSIFAAAKDRDVRSVMARTLLSGSSGSVEIVSRDSDLPFLNDQRNSGDFRGELDLLRENKRMLDRSGAHACLHRANSIAKAIRGAFAVQCIEADVVLGNGEAPPQIHHPPARATGFDLGTLLRIATSYSSHLWLDVKDLTDANCSILEGELAKIDTTAIGNLLVEFPTNININPRLQACAERLRTLGAEISYYLPRLCSSGEGDCGNQLADVRERLGSGIFTGVSFDRKSLNVVRSEPLFRKFRWHTWGYRYNELPEDPENYDFVIYQNSLDGTI